MEISEDKKVLEYRLNRISNAPRNWTCWIALFTLINGVMLFMKNDVTLLAGLAFPFILGGATPHLVAASIFAAAGFLWSRTKIPVNVVLAIYFLDLIFCAYLEYWSGVALHIVVFFFLLIAHAGAKGLAKKISEKEPQA